MKGFEDKVFQGVGTGSFSFHSLKPNEFLFAGLKILSAARGSTLPVFDTDNESRNLVLCANSQWVFCSLLFICKRYRLGIISQDNWPIRG